VGNCGPNQTKGSKREANNYRPVSLTSIPCKMLESVIKERMMDHMIANNLIKSTQHEFMLGFSCATDLISNLDSVTETKDSGKSIDVIYFDFSKAFMQAARWTS
jgi:hypothetical protein